MQMDTNIIEPKLCLRTKSSQDINDIPSKEELKRNVIITPQTVGATRKTRDSKRSIDIGFKKVYQNIGTQSPANRLTSLMHIATKDRADNSTPAIIAPLTPLILPDHLPVSQNRRLSASRRQLEITKQNLLEAAEITHISNSRQQHSFITFHQDGVMQEYQLLRQKINSINEENFYSNNQEALNSIMNDKRRLVELVDQLISNKMIHS